MPAARIFVQQRPGSSGGSSSRSSFFSGDSSSSHASSGTSSDSGSGHVTRGGFGGVRATRSRRIFPAAASRRPMQRITCPERDDWRPTAEQTGFDFHTIDGERYWDERAYYAFTLDEIEREIEGAHRRNRRDVPRTRRPRGRRRTHPAPAEDTGSVLAADLATAGTTTRAASTAGSTSPSTGADRRSCWSIMRTRRPRSSRRRCFNGPGWNRRSSGASPPRAPTSSIRSTSA